MSYEIENLFSIPLFKTNYGEISADEHDVVERCFIEGLYKNTLNFTSNNNYILDKELPDLKKFINKSIVSYVEEIIIGDEYDQDELSFQITQSWLNVSRPGQSHHKHLHNNSVISGVFYFQVNPHRDGITFYNSIPQQTIHINPKKYNHYNSGLWRVLVKSGDLLLFPSQLYHAVDQVIGREDRVSLSFNVFPRGTIGKQVELTELHI